MAEKSKKMLRILCLHGYRQTGPSFREKTGAFRKILKKKVEFVFITSPLVVPSMEENEKETASSGWWFSRPDSYFRAQDQSDCIKGFESSLEALETQFKENGPFDGILGFSQGAAMLALLCGLQQQGKLGFTFKFAIFVSAFKSRSAPHEKLYADKITIPTLHVYGETDQVIQKPMSEEILEYFVDPQVLVHPGGHFVPATGAQKNAYTQFIDRMSVLCHPEGQS